MPTVKFDQSRVIDEIRDLIWHEVQTRKTIPEQHKEFIYKKAVEATLNGRDLYHLAKALRSLNIRFWYPYSAETVATCIINRASCLMDINRGLEAGFEKAIWRHSNGVCGLTGKLSSKIQNTHKALSGWTYNIKDGIEIDGKTIWPGWEDGCKCCSKYVIPNYNDIVKLFQKTSPKKRTFKDFADDIFLLIQSPYLLARYWIFLLKRRKGRDRPNGE